jgi:hypothetical protein
MNPEPFLRHRPSVPASIEYPHRRAASEPLQQNAGRPRQLTSIFNMNLAVRCVAGVFLSALAPLQAGTQTETPPPRLVLQITVDQLRGDLPRRMLDRFGAGGFRTLLDSGAVFEAAHYSHAITETAPGHATLFSGANPREHGIVSNEWFELDRGVVYNTHDPEHALLGGLETSPGDGTSPRNLLSSTIGDELSLFTGGRAKVFAVSVKDRGAILPAGHRGKAFWYSSRTGGFVTSDHYYDAYPGWVEAWNARGLADAYAERSWELVADPSSYLAEDDLPWERGYKHLGRTFPHPYAGEGGRDLRKALAYTPAGDELVLEFAKTLLEAEGLGSDEVPDLLAVSFSSTDYVGHFYGPSSRESEDNLLRLDRILAQLLAFVDERVGLDRTVVVLSADHGAPETAEQLKANGQGAGWVDSAALLSACTGALRDAFGAGGELLRAHVVPYLWLDHARIAELELDAEEVAEVVARAALGVEGIAEAVTRQQLLEGELPRSPVHDRVAAAFHAGRGGDVFLVTRPHWMIGRGNPSAALSSLHGSPWTYDTYVPLVFLGGGIAPARVTRPVAPRDIAPTLAAILGTKPPTAATGAVLEEALPR